MMNMKVTNVKTHRIQTRRKTGHAYFFLTGESIMENLKNRRNRPTKEFRKLLNEVLFSEEVGCTPHQIGRITWSQKCGCSCGCSPGFRIEGFYGRDIFIDVKF
jgi:hypothetical protein